MAGSELEARITRYINENFLFTAGDSAIDRDVSLIDSGVFDSTGILEIIHFLEEELNVKVEDEEAIRENFDSIRAIADFVRAKMDRPGKTETG